MKKIVILGNSSSVVKLIEKIRTQGSEDEITLISYTGGLPYDRSRFPRFLAGEAKREDLYSCDNAFLSKNKVQVVKDKKITRVNFKRSTVYAEEREQFPFDILVMTELPSDRLPELKGVNKTGIFGMRKITDVIEMNNLLSVIDSAVIQSNSFSGIQFALSVSKRKKEISLVTSNERVLPYITESEADQWLTELFRSEGVHVYPQNSIAEILGDADMKAIRLTSKKVIACDLLVLGDLAPDLRIFSDAGLDMDRKINVDGNFKTSLDQVYALDTICAPVNGPVWDSDILETSLLEEHACQVGRHIQGIAEESGNVLTVRCAGKGALSVVEIGETTLSEKVTGVSMFSGPEKSYRKIFVSDDMIVGAVLVNANDLKEPLIKLVREKAKFSTSAFADSSPAAGPSIGPIEEAPLRGEEVSLAGDHVAEASPIPHPDQDG